MRIVFAILFIASLLRGNAQSDTIYVSDNDTVILDETQGRLYHLLVEKPTFETGRLWKVNLVQVGITRYNLGYERLIGNRFSSDSYLSVGYDYYGSVFDDVYSLRSIGVENELLILTEQQFKYYHNFDRRKRLGKPTSGFSGNFFSVGFSYSLMNQNKYRSLTYPDKIHKLQIGMKYGLQRRIGKLGYLELYCGLYYKWELGKQKYPNWTNDNPIVPMAGLKAGFAIDSFRNLRNILNP